MSFHLAAFNSSIANGAVLLQITNVADAIIATSNKGFLIPSDVKNLAFAAGVGTNLTRFQFTSGSIRKMFPWDFDRVNVGAVLENPVRWHDFTLAPIPLDIGEELDAFCVQSNAAAQQEYVFVAFSDGPLNPVNPGRIQTVHATGTTTLTANGWTSVALTLDNGLDGGQYAIVGATAFSAGALAFRFIPRGGGNPKRPGGFACQARDFYPPLAQRYGGWGMWMNFANTAVPAAEFFSVSADTSEEVFLDLVKIG